MLVVLLAGCPTVPQLRPIEWTDTSDTAPAHTGVSTPECPDCAWQVGDWLECSSPCGEAEGAQLRTVECRDDGALTDPDRCDPERMPPASRPCTPTEDCVWFESGWSACSSTCGEGQQWQTVSCQSPGGVTVDPHLCPGQQPPNVQDCLDTSACAWDVGGWSSCSATCQGDPGTETRQVWCEDPADVVVDYGWCPQPAPDDTQACAGATPWTSWTVGNWGLCDIDCTQRRSVTCPGGCCSGPRPSSLQGCTDGLCDLCDPLCP